MVRIKGKEMKIHVSTYITFPDEDYKGWVNALRKGGTPIDEKELTEKGAWRFMFNSDGSSNTFKCKHTTTYKIIKEKINETNRCY